MKTTEHPCSDRGSVMMEYVILNFLFMVVIAVSGYFFVNPYGGVSGQATYDIDLATGEITENTQRTTKQYGILGNAFMQRYKLMLQIVSMPYP